MSTYRKASRITCPRTGKRVLTSLRDIQRYLWFLRNVILLIKESLNIINATPVL